MGQVSLILSKSRCALVAPALPSAEKRRLKRRQLSRSRSKRRRPRYGNAAKRNPGWCTAPMTRFSRKRLTSLSPFSMRQGRKSRPPRYQRLLPGIPCRQVRMNHFQSCGTTCRSCVTGPRRSLANSHAMQQALVSECISWNARWQRRMHKPRITSRNDQAWRQSSRPSRLYSMHLMRACLYQSSFRLWSRWLHCLETRFSDMDWTRPWPVRWSQRLST